MPLFERKREEDTVTGDAATRALSVTAVENAFVESVYDKLAKVYDFTFGPTLHPGRLQAIERMDIQSGERVLEVGVGTGINLSLYPKNCSVVGIDFSGPMLEIARERAARKDVRNVRLLQMDAADLKTRLALKTLLMPGGLGSTLKVLIVGKGVGRPALRGCSFGVRMT